MDYISSWCKSRRRLDGSTVIVTGCNTGIGRETVADLYTRGARVIMACRDVTKAEAAKASIASEKAKEEGHGTLIVEQLDLSSLQSVRGFAATILANEPKVNILINNAGVMCCPEGKTEDGFETHIGTNHFGHALLTLLLLPKLIENAPSRIVCVSSYLHKMSKLNLDDINFEKTAYDPLKAYCRSKAANVLFAKGLAQKLREHGIADVSTYSLHPGVINTEIGRHFSDTILYGASWLFRYVMGWFVKSPRCGAQTIIYCALDEGCAEESGQYYYECAVSTPSKQCQDDTIADQFWDLTIDALKLHDYKPFIETKRTNSPSTDIARANNGESLS